MQQMHDRVVYHPAKVEWLAKKNKQVQLWVLMFLKKKKCRKIKGRVVADGWKQRNGLKKSDVTSPESATESILITVAINTTENMDVAFIEAPGEFLT